jgi:hypothetical protein
LVLAPLIAEFDLQIKEFWVGRLSHCRIPFGNVRVPLQLILAVEGHVGVANCPLLRGFLGESMIAELFPVVRFYRRSSGRGKVKIVLSMDQKSS